MSNLDSSQSSSKQFQQNSSRARNNRDDFSSFLNLQPTKPIQLSVLEGRVALIFPEQNKKDDDWQAIVQRLNQKLANPNTTWNPQTPVDLVSGNRLIDGRQLQLVSKLLANAKLILDCIHTSRRQTAMAAVTAGYSVQQTTPNKLLESLEDTQSKPIRFDADIQPDPTEPLFLTKTLRSGIEVRHSGMIVMLGDINPGGTLISDGDILVWGRLRGVAHAGASGDRSACIMALKMEPTQLRIADKVARAPANKLEEFYPEVAHIAADSIRITRAYDFSRLN